MGVDYVPLSTTVIMPAGARTVTLPVTPLANAARTAPAAVTMTVAVGTGYNVSPSASIAGVTIIPTGTPNGTGLTGTYYNGSGIPYTSSLNFKPSTLSVDTAHGNVLAPAGALANGSIIYFGGTTLPAPLQANTAYYVRDLGMFGVDLNVAASNGGPAIALTTVGSNFGYYFQSDRFAVDFKWSTAGSLPSGLNGGNFCVRWTGQVQPQYTETYYFDVYARQASC